MQNSILKILLVVPSRMRGHNFICLFSRRSAALVDVMIECKALPKLVDMMLSDHEVMQNEALLAVTILSSLRLASAEKGLTDSKIGEKLSRLVNERKPKKEVFANILKLVNQLSTSGKLSGN